MNAINPFSAYQALLAPWMQAMSAYHAPLSGDVVQDINPVTSWLSPQFEFNFAGDRQLESKVVSDVASYGKQLGLLTEAILEVAKGEQGEAVDKLEDLQAQIEQVKQQHQGELVDQLKKGLSQLASSDPAALQALLAGFSE